MVEKSLVRSSSAMLEVPYAAAIAREAREGIP
jgi:hypothetical protein